MLLFTMYLLACTRVCTFCLHLEQAFETVLEEMKLDTDVLEETLALSLELVLCRALTVAYTNKPCRVLLQYVYVNLLRNRSLVNLLFSFS